MRSTVHTTYLLFAIAFTAPWAGAAQSAPKAPSKPDPQRSREGSGTPERRSPSRLPGLQSLAPGQASTARRGAPARTSPASILALPEIQAELNLTEPQKRSLHALFVQSRIELRSMKPLMEKTPRAEQEKFLARYRKQYNAQLLQVLRPEQFERYHQILFQERGIVAVFNNEEAMKSLGITDQQRAEILELRKLEIRELFQLPRNQPSQFAAARVKTLRQQGEAKMLARLTKRQRAEWQKLLGPPFHGLATR